MRRRQSASELSGKNAHHAVKTAKVLYADNLPALLKVRDIAELFGIGERAARTWCACGKVPAVKIGASWYVPKDALRELLREGAA